MKDWTQRLQKGHLIKQHVEIDLKKSSVYYKHLLYFADSASRSWYKPPQEVEYRVNCQKSSLQSN